MFLVGWAPPTRTNAVTPGQWWAKPTLQNFVLVIPAHSPVIPAYVGQHWLRVLLLDRNYMNKIDDYQGYINKKLLVYMVYTTY